MKHQLIYAALFLALAANAKAQTLLYSFDGTHDGDAFGESVDGLGDVNGDGFDDFIVGQPNYESPGPPLGMVHVYSGVDGSVLYSVQGVASSNFGTVLSSTPDLNGDGIEDFVVGAYAELTLTGEYGSVYAFSGLDGTLIWKTLSPPGLTQSSFGKSVSDAGDVNADGTCDVIVGSVRSQSGTTGTVFLLSGTDGTPIYSSTANPPEQHFGRNISGLGDVNNDGFDDFAVADLNNNGRVRVFSGIDGALMPSHNIVPSPGSYQFGAALASGSDINGDGINDLIVGNAAAYSHSSPNPAASVYSGADGTTLLTLDLGQRVTGGRDGGVSFIGDMNGDGVDDILVGRGRVNRKRSSSPYFAPSDFELSIGMIRVYSGTDGTPLLTIHGTEEFHRFGHSVANAGDVNGDGYDDLLVSQVPGFPYYGVVVRAPGGVRVYAGGPLPASFVDVCNGDGGVQAGCTDCPCANTATAGTIGGCLNSNATSARLHATGNASTTLALNTTSDLRFTLTGGTPNSTCILRSSRTVPPGDLAHPCYGLYSGSRSMLFDGLRCIGPSRRLHGARRTDSNGDVGITNDPWGGEGAPPAGVAQASILIAGHVRHFQVWYRDVATLSCARGVNTSQAIRIVFEP